MKRRTQHHRQCGFTLLETLLALAIAALLLTAVTALIVSLFTLWSTQRTTDQAAPARATAVLLENAFHLNPHADDSSGWQMDWPDNERTGDPPSLSWQSDVRSPLLPPVESAGTWEYRLHHEPARGLLLAWRPVDEIEPQDFRYTLLSDTVEGLRYAYFDPERERWSVYDTPPDPERVDNRLPELLAIDHRIRGETETLWLLLPQLEAQ